MFSVEGGGHGTLGNDELGENRKRDAMNFVCMHICFHSNATLVKHDHHHQQQLLR